MERLWHACFCSDYIRWQLALARTFTAAENTSILLLSDPGEHLIFAASAGERAEDYTAAGDYTKALRVEMSAGFGLNPLAVLYGKPISMERSDPRHNPAIDQALGVTTRSLYTVPLAAGEQTVGTLSTINAHADARDESRDRFTSDDIAALHAVAEAVGFWLDTTWGKLTRDTATVRTS